MGDDSFLFSAHRSSELLKTKLMKLLNYSDMIILQREWNINVGIEVCPSSLWSCSG